MILPDMVYVELLLKKSAVEVKFGSNWFLLNAFFQEVVEEESEVSFMEGTCL
jgi:hypothetical protein